ncbi:MAG TPA: flavodoxin family protein [Anaerolineae bacterium]|nr:flavodoxin family protein [Anaerolineae bacterium]HUW95885.1 flavodoxin family protein [Anaerolineae bacterium]
MRLKVLGLAGSPRRHGNTELLLDQVLGGAASKGAQTEKIILGAMTIDPCDECEACYETGRCIVQDDYQLLYPRLIKAERIVLAAPIFFMGLPAQAKAFIDRCQCFWARKYVLQDPLPPTDTGVQRQGFLISTAGGADTSFRCAVTSLKAFLDTLYAAYGGELTFPGVDEKGAILSHATALEDALALGKRLAAGEE